MRYEAKDFSSIKGMKGFSDELLEDHFGLYKGYVSHTNELLDEFETLAKKGDLGSVQHAELRRRLAFEFDGMRLHELYFGNLGGDGKYPADVKSMLESGFGSPDRWEEEFRAVGSMRGVGWAILYLDPVAKRPVNFWIDEHHGGHPTGSVPLVVMDVWEHAFMTDYGTDRASYIDAFMGNIDWKVVAKRLGAAAKTEIITR